MTDTKTNAKVIWKDATSYALGQRREIEPLTWECTIYGVRVWVTCDNIYYPGKWIVNCDFLEIDRRPIAEVGEIPLSEILNKALRLVGHKAAWKADRCTEIARIIEANHD